MKCAFTRNIGAGRLSLSSMRFGRDCAGLDLYELLGVPPSATAQEVRRAYRRKARESHPDLHPENPALVTRMRDLNLAARVLLDPPSRAAYDRLRAQPESERPQRWWERSGEETCDWVEPPEHPKREPAPRGWLDEIRGRAARVFSGFDDWLHALPPRGRLLVGSLGVGLALMLLAVAYPRLGASADGERPRPVSISPAVLTP